MVPARTPAREFPLGSRRTGVSRAYPALMRRSMLVLPLAALLTLALGAQAFALAKPRWKSPVVTYRDNSKGTLDRNAVKIAIKWWNDAPAGPLYFKKAKSGQKANVTFYSVNTSGVDYDGLATYYTDKSGTYLTRARMDLNDYFLRTEDPEYVAEVTAHELGHAFGLPHLGDKCSLMYPSGSVATRCPTNAGPKLGPGQFYCGPQKSDVQSAISRYGGSLGSWPGTICSGTPPSSRRGVVASRIVRAR